MAVNLTKGQKVSLVKADGKKLTKLMVGIGWDAAVQEGGFFKNWGQVSRFAHFFYFFSSKNCSNLNFQPIISIGICVPANSKPTNSSLHRKLEHGTR